MRWLSSLKIASPSCHIGPWFQDSTDKGQKRRVMLNSAYSSLPGCWQFCCCTLSQGGCCYIRMGQGSYHGHKKRGEIFQSFKQSKKQFSTSSFFFSFTSVTFNVLSLRLFIQIVCRYLSPRDIKKAPRILSHLLHLVQFSLLGGF